MIEIESMGSMEQRERSGDVRAIVPDDVNVVFQPIVNLKSGELFASEALVRCKWPSFTAPPVLFDAAVEQKACGRLGRIIREVTFHRGTGVPLFVNLHPHELSSRWIVQPDDPLCFHDAEVYLEITESAALDYFDLCRGVLREVCHRTGAKLVIDDFGAGYSNLMRIVDLAPAVVKPYLALVRDVHRNKRKRTLLESVVRLCDDLGATVVGEGIEEADELMALQDAGVQFGQGYFLAKPGPINAPHFWPKLA